MISVCKTSESPVVTKIESKVGSVVVVDVVVVVIVVVVVVVTVVVVVVVVVVDVVVVVVDVVIGIEEVVPCVDVILGKPLVINTSLDDSYSFLIKYNAKTRKINAMIVRA